MEREVGGGIGMGNTCKPLAVSFQCMTKSTTNKKIKQPLIPGGDGGEWEPGWQASRKLSSLGSSSS